MLTETIKYKDLNGDDAEAVVHFNLTKAEALELNIRQDLEIIGRSNDRNVIMDGFRKFMQASYGVRTPEGQFLKLDHNGSPYFNSFATTEAYSELFIRLFSDADYAAEFVKGVLPKDAGPLLDEQRQQSQSNIPEHLREHPSMQGRRAKQEPKPASTIQVTDEPVAPIPSHQPDPITPPAQRNPEDDPEYQAFLKFQASQRAQAQTPPDRVSPPEAAPISNEPPRSDLI